MMLEKELEGMRKQLADAQLVRMNSEISRLSLIYLTKENKELKRQINILQGSAPLTLRLRRDGKHWEAVDTEIELNY